jgi:CBS domain-containing protein
MRDHGVGCLVAIHDGRPMGLVTDRDLVVRVLAHGIDPKTSLLADFVTYNPVTVATGESVDTASERMRMHGVRRLPLVDERGQVVGIVTADDLIVLLGSELAGVCDGIAGSVESRECR